MDKRGTDNTVVNLKFFPSRLENELINNIYETLLQTNTNQSKEEGVDNND